MFIFSHRETLKDRDDIISCRHFCFCGEVDIPENRTKIILLLGQNQIVYDSDHVEEFMRIREIPSEFWVLLYRVSGEMALLLE